MPEKQGYVLADVEREFRRMKDLADRALAQVTDERLFATLDGEANSLALLVKHLAGNLRSRWTNFLTTDGEKPDRYRDAEFVLDATDTRQTLMKRWEAGWQILLDTLGSLGPADLERTVRVRGEPHSAHQAMLRQLTHSAYHVGQIVLLAKHWAGAAWQTLSIPRGKSEEYNRAMQASSTGRGPRA